MNDTSQEHVEPLIEAHFQGRLEPKDVLRMRAHLTVCARCQRHYERARLVAALDPVGLDDKARLRVALGFPHPARRRVGYAPLWAGAALAAAGAMALLAMPADGPPARSVSSGFQARGADPDMEFHLQVFRVDAHDGKHPLPPGARITAETELTFSFDAGPKAYVMLFAQDARGQVHWYAPAWTDAATDPAAVAVPAGPLPHPLGEAEGDGLVSRRAADRSPG